MSSAVPVTVAHAGSRTSTDKPLRVTAVIATESVSGPGRQLAALAAHMRREGVDFRVLLFQRAARPLPYADHLGRLAVPYAVIADRGPCDWRMIGRAREVFDDWQPDIVQTHGYKATALLYILKQKQTPYRWIGFFHGSTAESMRAHLYHSMDTRMLCAADQVVVMSTRQLERFTSVGKRASVIYNAILPTSSAGRASGDAPAVPANRVIGVVGRLSREKGVDVFLRACSILQQRSCSFSAVIAGDGPEAARLRLLSEQLHLTERVAFTGFAADMDEVYARIQLLVIPSRSEGLPNTLLEAINAGVFTIATDVGAIRDVLCDDTLGILIDPEEPVAMADAIQQALGWKADAAYLAARAETIARFSIEQRVDEHHRLYREVVQGVEARH